MDREIVGSPQELLAESWDRCFTLASKRGFPAFLEPIALSNPMNSGPYVASLSSIKAYCLKGRRSHLLNDLLALLEKVEAYGRQPVMLMLGGSFIRWDLEPNDLDCVVFYTNSKACASEEHGPAPRVAHGLDIRMVPLDVAPLTAAKFIAYFSLLYSQSRAGSGEPRGCILVDLDCAE